MIRYTYDTHKAEVRAVECERSGYPHKDANGKTQLAHSHFDTWGEAHAMLVAELAALIRIDMQALDDINVSRSRMLQALDDDTQRLARAKELLPC